MKLNKYNFSLHTPAIMGICNVTLDSFSDGGKNYKTNVTEFYNLQYLYENDCLRAGIEFNKSYYNDKDLEPENTLLFTLTIIPFGKINTPSLSGL